MYSTREVANQLGLSQNQVRYLLLKGKISGKKAGQHWVVMAIDYKRKRKSKVAGGRVKVSPEQLELLKLISKGWKVLRDYDTAGDKYYWVHSKHKVPIVWIESTIGERRIIYVRNKAKKEELRQALEKHWTILSKEGYDYTYIAFSPKWRQRKRFRNLTIYALEDKGLLCQLDKESDWYSSEPPHIVLTDKGKQVLREQS